MTSSNRCTRPRLLAVLAAAAAAVLWTGAAAPVDADGSPVARLLEQKAPSIVCVKIVLKIHQSRNGQSRDGEQKTETRGVMVAPSGLVMYYDGSDVVRNAQRRQPGLEVSVTPTSIHVLFGNEAKEHEAAFVVHDTNFGLAFVQIVDLEGLTPAAQDLSAGAEPKLGQALFGVSRLPRGFDCAPEIERLYVSMPVTQPRPMWGVVGQFGAIGLPAYEESGKPVGILAMQEGAEGAEQGGNGPDFGAFLLPLPIVSKSIAAAVKRVPEALEKAKAAKEAAKEAPKEPEPSKDAPPAMTDAPPMGDEPKPDQPPK